MAKHPRYVKIEVDGNMFASMAELARFYGLNYQQVTKRYKAGYTPEEIAHGKKNTVHNAQSIICAGKIHSSFAALAREYGVHVETVRIRIKKRNWSPEEAVGIKKRSAKTEVEFKGQIYSGKSALARAYGINKGTFYQRLQSGWLLEEALGVDPHKSKSGGARYFEFKKRPQECDGKHYQSIAHLAKDFGVKESTVRSRLNIGWTSEQAVGIEAAPTDRSILVDGKKFKNMEEAASHYGILPATFRFRIKRDWTPEQAAGVESPPRAITICDQSFASLADAAKEFGITYSTIKGRIRLGWSLEEAFEIAPRDTPLYGSYSEKFFKENPEAKNNLASLYFVFLINKETGESFHKIGITAQSLKTRFRTTRYTAETIATAETTLYEAWQRESLIQNALSEHKYMPLDEGFSGRTECFKLTPDLVGEIAELIEGIASSRA